VIRMRATPHYGRRSHQLSARHNNQYKGQDSPRLWGASSPIVATLLAVGSQRAEHREGGLPRGGRMMADVFTGESRLPGCHFLS